MRQILPYALKANDTVGIFSPSEPLTEDRQRRMQTSLKLLSQNYQYRFATNALAESSYMAGSRLERISDIADLLADPTIDALLASWGGKSANQLVRDLPYDKFLAARKPVIGFSDACVLLNAITAVTGLITFAGPNIAGKLVESSHWDLGLLRGISEPPFGRTAKDCWNTIVPGHAHGQLFGGNLSTFVLGTVGTEAMALMSDASHADIHRYLGLAPSADGRQGDKWVIYLYSFIANPGLGGDLLKRYAWEKLSRSSAFTYALLGLTTSMYFLAHLLLGRPLPAGTLGFGSFYYSVTVVILMIMTYVEYYKRNSWNYDLLVKTTPVLMEALKLQREQVDNTLNVNLEFRHRSKGH